MSCLRCLAPILLLCLLAQAGVAQEDLSELKVHTPRNIQIVIEDLTEDAQDLGLSKGTLQSQLEMYLRKHNLNPVDQRTSGGFVYLSLPVAGEAYTTSVEFIRMATIVTPDGTETVGAEVWSSASVGMHGGDPNHVARALGNEFVEFLGQYYKANDL